MEVEHKSKPGNSEHRIFFVAKSPLQSAREHRKEYMCGASKHKDVCNYRSKWTGRHPQTINLICPGALGVHNFAPSQV